MIDCIYIAACARDARLTRICVASIRFFYPDIPIRLLAGDILQKGLDKELKKYWNVDLVNIPSGDYGWGLVKLEPLFMNDGESFLVMDVDTVMTGRILEERDKSAAPFFVDDEFLSDSDFKRLYYDWDEMQKFDPLVPSARKAFNVGQWFGKGGLVKRHEFNGLVDWTFPRKLKYPHLFMGGDQGVINYVVLKKESFEELKIDRKTIMRWPANGMDDLTPDKIANGSAPALIVHWAGMKKTFVSRMVGSELLLFFERFYYSRIPNAKWVRLTDITFHIYLQWKHNIQVRLSLALRKYFKSNSPGVDKI